MKRSYAVIDLEATGPKFEDGGRLFQFGCAIIEEGVVIQEVEVTINPETQIPSAVESLTGIMNEDVKDAPYFDEVANSLYHLLEGRTIVAHNVSFDYPFLVQSFAGLADINWQAEACIDTVQLAQICLPTADSYRLSDLSQLLGLEHTDAHSAGSDASATAQLFLTLQKKIHQLPHQTLEQLVLFSEDLIEQTGMVFAEALGEHTDGNVLPIEWCEGIAISPKSPQPLLWKEVTDDAVTLYRHLSDEGVITYQLEQEKMIRYLDERLSAGDSLTWIEGEPGVGKTLAYILVAVSRASREHPIWIASSTLLLQQQLLEQECLPLLEKLGLSIPVATIKGQHHYISLSAMRSILEHSDEYHMPKYAVAMMGLLVWLTQTQTGDLNELNSVLYVIDLWEKLTTREKKRGVVDYYKRAFQQALLSPIVITNHAYVSQHLPNLSRKEGFKKPILFLDEVQQLESTLESLTQKVLSFDLLWELQQRWSDYHMEEHVQWDSQSDFTSRKINRLLLEACDLYEEWSEVVMKENRPYDSVIYASKEWPSTYHYQMIQALKKTMSQLLREYHQFTQNPLLATRSHHQTETLMRLLVQMTTIKEGFMIVSRRMMRGQAMLEVTAASSPLPLWEKLRQSCVSVVGISATIPTYSPLFYQIVTSSEVFRLSPRQVPFEHVVMLPTDLPTPTLEWSDEQASDMAVWMTEIYHRVEGRMLVLVHSVEALEALERYLSQTDIPLLVQRTAHSSRKLQRKFQQEEAVILLGVASFWEGFDSGEVSIDQLVLTKLPFPNPESIQQQLVQEVLHEQGRNYFKDYALPRMLQQLYQGIGRMSRPHQQAAEIWILDVRATMSSYAAQVQQTFPPTATLLKKSFKKLMRSRQK